MWGGERIGYSRPFLMQLIKNNKLRLSYKMYTLYIPIISYEFVASHESIIKEEYSMPKNA